MESTDNNPDLSDLSVTPTQTNEVWDDTTIGESLKKLNNNTDVNAKKTGSWTFTVTNGKIVIA